MLHYNSAAYTALPSDLVDAIMDRHDEPADATGDLAEAVDSRSTWHVREEDGARRAILRGGHAWWVLSVEADRPWGIVRSLRPYATLDQADEAMGW
jgi:hypothetical protein